jgi:hypothetical protein
MKNAFSSLHNNTRTTQSNYSLASCYQSSVLFQSLPHLISIASPRNRISRRLSLELSLDAILAVAAGMKEDLQRQANQGVMRNDLNRALGALASINAVDDFVYRLKIRSGSQLGLSKPARPPAKSPLRRHLEIVDEKVKSKRQGAR